MSIRNVALAALLALAVSPPALQADGQSHHRGRAVYEVTITNVTRDQTFTPFLVVAHRSKVSLFEVGQPASDELEALAENGVTGPFQEKLAATPGVHGITIGGGLLAPGQTTTMKVEGHRYDRVSLAAMLIPTNDGFIALSSAGPFGRGLQSTHAPAYDAGTEVNDELCASIPGPFYDECGAEGGGGAPEGGEEGFVHIHRGMHGVGDFIAANRDWRNPVAKVSIRRIQ